MQPDHNNQISLKEQGFHVGQNLDILDSVNKWMNGEVRFVGNGSIFIHYTGWSNKYDQSIPVDSNRILKQWQPGQIIKINNRIDAYHPVGGWLQARVIEKQFSQQQKQCKRVKVHFFNYHVKYDIWVDIDDPNSVAIIGLRSKAYGMGKNRKKLQQVQKYSALLQKILAEKTKILHDKLESKNLAIKQAGGDGNCLFRSISDQLYGTQQHYAEIRKFCMDYISYEKVFFQDYISQDIDQYIQRKRKNAQWGDDVEIQALSEIYARPIQIFVFDDSPIRTFHEENKNQIEPLRLNYAGACHYNSIKYIDKMDKGIIQQNFGEYEQLFFSTYKSNMDEIIRNRDLFSFSNRIQDSIEQRLEAQKRQETKIQDQLCKALQISETQAMLEQIQNAQLKQFQNKYEQEKLQQQLKKLQEKQIQQAKKISQQQQQIPMKEQQLEFQTQKPYWFDQIKALGFTDKQIWFAIQVKGYDPDEVQNFLLDNLD